MGHRLARLAVLAGAFAVAPIAAGLSSCELVLPGDSDLLGGGGAPDGGTTASTGPGGRGGAGGHGVGGASTSSAGGGGAGPCAGGFPLSAGAGAASGSCCVGDLDAGCVGYQILRTTTVPVLDGCCDEPMWKNAPAIDFRGYRGGIDGGTFDNAFQCKLLWQDQVPKPVLYGCCEVKDTDIVAVYTADAGPDGAVTIFSDDGIEYVFADTRGWTSHTVKSMINVAQQAIDQNYPDGGGDPSFDTGIIAAIARHGTLDHGNDTDTGYTIEWTANITIPAAEVRGMPLFCEFLLHDRDSFDITWAASCGAILSANDPTSWSVCAFSNTMVDQ